MNADFETIHHVARLAFLAMSARAVASAEFEKSGEVSKMVITVGAPVSGEGAELPIDVEWFEDSHAVGGMSL